jgi:hypothetical protein
MESVRGFYAIGGTRIRLLDTLLVMVVLGALCVPLGHLALKFLFRKVRAKVEAERAAASAHAGAQAPADAPRNDDHAASK